MTLSVSTQVSPVGSKLIKQTSGTGTADTDVTGTSGSIYMIELDNSSNADNPAYLKIYDSAAPTVGTTAPNHIIEAKTSSVAKAVYPDGLPFTNLSFAVVIAPGTAGTTSPTAAVPVTLVTT